MIYINKEGLTEKYIQMIKEAYPNIITEDINAFEEIEGILTYAYFVKRENLEKYPHLRWIQLYSAGFDGVDFAYLQERGITLSNAKDIYAATIAEDIMARILAINRNVFKYYDLQKQKKWQALKSEYELTSSTIGIIGAGSIGQELARRLANFNVKIIGYRRRLEIPKYFDAVYNTEQGLDELCMHSDYIILTIPLNKETEGLIDLRRLKIMKKSTVLINVSRGMLIKQDDLIYALEQKMIRAASLDVMTPEPLPANSKLWELENVYITPHNALSSPYLLLRLTSFLIENIKNFINKEKIQNIVREK